MLKNQYEHHSFIHVKNSLPFIFKHLENCTDTDCNWHKNIELLLVTKGCGFIKYDSETFPIDEGNVIVINSDTIHYVYSESLISFCYLIIDDNFFLENGIDIKNYHFIKRISDTRLTALYTRAAKSFCAHKAAPDTLSIARIRSDVLRLVIYLCNNCSILASEASAQISNSEKYVKEAMLYINENFTSRIGLDMIAKRIGVNKSHLSRIFKEYSGHTLHTYINILRCKEAARCIDEGMSIADAAMHCGFETLSYFSRTYKKLMGVCPSGRKAI